MCSYASLDPLLDDSGKISLPAEEIAVSVSSPNGSQWITVDFRATHVTVSFAVMMCTLTKKAGYSLCISPLDRCST
jgi:hypothetical protein